MTEHRIRAVNASAMDLHFGIFKEQASEHDGVMWKVLSLSKPQPHPTTGIIPWSMSYEVTIPQKQASGDSYVGGLSFPAVPGKNYELFLDADNFYKIREFTSGGLPNSIGFRNSTKVTESLGLMMSGTLLTMQRNVASRVVARFDITPGYYCGIYPKVNQGEIVSRVTALDTAMITIPTGLTTATLRAEIVKGEVKLGEVIYS